MQVDIRDFNLKRWVPGVVVRFDRDRVKVSKDGYGEEYDRMLPWYDPTVVDYCGEKITDRVCHYQSRKPGKEDKYKDISIKICFTPKSDCPKGF